MEITGFRIERLIAEGGMASVYLAVQESLGRHVALKLLKKFERPEDSDRFINEGRIIAALNHPNIITIHDIGFDGERPFIAMEYLEGGSLTQRIERGMTAEAAMDVVIAIGACLDFVHRQGMIHRDVKPANILFHSNGTPKLTDFGIAKSMEVDSDLTLDGSAVGSPFYLSPEQAQNKPLDGRADVYSLGIIFYEMLTGRKPFRSDSHIETILSHVTDQLPPLPVELGLFEEALELMTAKDPDDRFSSAGEMLGYFRALRSLSGVASGSGAGNHVTTAYAPGFAEKGRKWLRAPRLAIAASASLGLLLLGWVAGGWLGSSEPERSLSLSTAPPDVAGYGPGSPLPASTNQIRSPAAAALAQQSPADELEPLSAATGAGAGPMAVLAVEPEPQAASPSLSAPVRFETSPFSVSARVDPEPPADSNIRVEDGPLSVDDAAPDGSVWAHISGEPTGDELGPDEAAANEDEQNREPDISQLLDLADQALAEYRLTIPAQDSALYYFKEVLRLEPGQAQAERGLDRIADRYAGLGRREIDNQAFEKAERYLQRGLQVRPDYAPLLEAQGLLDARRLELAAAAAARQPVIETPEPREPEPPAQTGGLQSIFQH